MVDVLTWSEELQRTRGEGLEDILAVGDRSNAKKARVGCVESNWVATECIWVASSRSYERECIRSVLFTHGASADLVGLIMSAPI